VISEKHSESARRNIAKAHAKQIKGDGLTANQRYYRKNKEASAERVRKWRAKNKEAANVLNRRHYANTAESRREEKRNYWRDVLSKRPKTDSERLADRLRRQKRREAGLLTRREWEEIVLQHGGKCAYCGDSSSKLTIDHVIPISKGGRNEKQNVVPACGPCNSSKGNRYEVPPRAKAGN